MSKNEQHLTDADHVEVSPKKRDANRRNAQNSTGPRTARGKINSSLNALKRGLFSKNVVMVLTKQEAKDYSAIVRELIQHYAPANFLEELLVKKLAEMLWREAQTQKWESVLLERLETSAKEAQEKIISTVNVPKDLERLVDYGNRFSSRADKLIQELERRRREWRTSFASAPLEGN